MAFATSTRAPSSPSSTQEMRGTVVVPKLRHYSSTDSAIGLVCTTSSKAASEERRFREVEVTSEPLQGTGNRARATIIDVEQYTIIRQIGKGQWCRVVEAKFDDHSIAIKTPGDRSARSVIEREAEILADLSAMPNASNHIVQYLAYIRESDSLALEYLPNNLGMLCRPRGLEAASLRLASSQLVAGLSFLHENNVIHGDIKPANILIRQTHEGLRFLYCDFSASRYDNPESKPSESAGTYDFMSPEDFRLDCVSTKASDIYSLGMTLLAAALGRSVYSDIPNAFALRACAASGCPLQLVQGDVGFEKKLEDAGLMESLKAVLKKDANGRLVARQWVAALQEIPGQDGAKN